MVAPSPARSATKTWLLNIVEGISPAQIVEGLSISFTPETELRRRLMVSSS